MIGSWHYFVKGNAEPETNSFVAISGSGKRALLDVISGRAQGSTRGQVLLNGAPLSSSDFKKCGAYVGKRNDLLSGLSTEQTLLYAASLELGSKVNFALIHT
jgi:ATP-binding cassette, subfamily G (WHITE), member 5 (sterolin 1)